MAKVAFIGLGVMGYPMAGYIAKAGHEVTVYNRTQAKADQWAAEYGKHNGKAASTPAAAAKEAEFVFSCVGNDDDLRSVTTGKHGAFETLRKGAIFIDNTTASAEVARELGQAAEKLGAGFIDAPVSGGQAGAENGTLTVMCGGDEATFNKAKLVIACYAKMVGLMGPTGAGQLTKMVNQICIAGLVQGLSEGIHFAQNAGLDVEAVINVISKGAAGSWQMENRHKTMNEGKYNHGFAVDWMRKDLAICLSEASKNGSSLPGTALIDQYYSDVQNMGGNRWDTGIKLALANKLSGK
ncbi:MAG: NAD(P)-dependent oxidoreductase [Ahrensia sp.]|nr:NAD(P)-dependent oxidoreductase [Ahrensia sp.]